MNKQLQFLTVLVLICALFLVGCDTKKNVATPPAETSTTSVEAPEEANGDDPAETEEVDEPAVDEEADPAEAEEETTDEEVTDEEPMEDEEEEEEVDEEK